MPENGRHGGSESSPDFRSPILRAERVANWQEGRATLQEAQKLAEEIKTSAEAEARQIKRQALEDARQSGAQEASRLVVEATARIDRDLTNIEGQIADLALQVVEEIIGEFKDEDLLFRATRHAISMLRSDRRLTVYVAPPDAAELQRRLEQDFEAGDPLAIPIVQGDEKLAPGSCVIASAVGFIEASVETQLAAFRAALHADSE